MRAVMGTSELAAVAWPIADGVAQAVVGFVAPGRLPADRLREALRGRLPSHMVPAVIHELAPLPRKAAGKLDCRPLVDNLAAEAVGDALHE